MSSSVICDTSGRDTDLAVNKDTSTIKPGLTSEQGHFHHQAGLCEWSHCTDWSTAWGLGLESQMHWDTDTLCPAHKHCHVYIHQDSINPSFTLFDVTLVSWVTESERSVLSTSGFMRLFLQQRNKTKAEDVYSLHLRLFLQHWYSFGYTFSACGFGCILATDCNPHESLEIGMQSYPIDNLRVSK